MCDITEGIDTSARLVAEGVATVSALCRLAKLANAKFLAVDCKHRARNTAFKRDRIFRKNKNKKIKKMMIKCNIKNIKKMLPHTHLDSDSD